MAKKGSNDRNDDLKTAVKVAKKVAPSKATTKKLYRKSGLSKAAPYIAVFFAIIFLIFLVTVKALELEDGAGLIGYWTLRLFCGLFGGATYIVPLLIGFIGVIWIVFDLKWSSGKSDEGEAKSAHRRVVVKTTLSYVIFFLFSTLLGVFANCDDLNIGDMWLEGYENFAHGGIVGDSLGYLFNMAFKPVVASIIIIILMLICLCFTVGITPSYIAAKIRCKREMRDEEIEIDEEAQDRKYELLRQKELEKAKKRKERELEARKRRELEEFKRAQEESDEPELVPYNEPTKKARQPKKQFSEEEMDEVLDGLDDNETEEIPEPELKPIELDDEPVQSSESGFSEYGGDAVIDGETVNLEEILDEVEKEPVPKPAPAKKQEAPIVLSEINTDELTEDLATVTPDEGDGAVEEILTPYIFPPVDMLSENKNAADTDAQAELQENARILKETLKSFKVEIKDIQYSRGPTITRYELRPEVGTRVRSIANLVDDIALSLATSGVRIEAPIPNKPAVGIEVPNRVRATVYLRDLVETSKFTDSKSRLTSCLGMDVGGNPVYFDIGKMPHLLIAGTTGSGKSVCINTIILSILYKARPDEVRLILIDPKQVEFTVYENIPHLYCPIVSEPKKAAGALASAVSEMERRFELIKSVGVRNIEAYNEVTANDPDKEYLPKMVIIIDELADLMMTARDEVETSICRLAQKARAAGIHVILGTQRPSVDVITGLIKANVPSRIACTVTSQVDSRTIIDVAGAENLIGYGDMLFAPVGAAKPMRVQGAFVSDNEVENIVSFIKENNNSVKYNNEFIESMEENARNFGNSGKKGASSSDSESSAENIEGGDSKFHDAVKLAIEEGKISTSLMQRRLGVGYGRAAKMIDEMVELGYVSKPDGNKPRRVLITMEEYMRRVSEGSLGDEE